MLLINGIRGHAKLKQLKMKKLLFLSLAMLLYSTLSAQSWTKTFVVTSGEESLFGLFPGKEVVVTRSNYSSWTNDVYIIKLPSFPEPVVYRFQRVATRSMGGMNFGNYSCGGHQLQIRSNDQKNPDWLRVGECELREKRR